MNIKKKKLHSQLLENDPELIKEISNNIIDYFFEHINSDIKYPVKDFSKAKVIKVDKFSKNNINIKKLLNIIDTEIFDQAIYKCQVNYLRFIDDGSSAVNIIASTINSLLNQNLTTHLSDSPGATFNEISLIREIRQRIGYDVGKDVKSIAEVGGYFTSGGMMSNMAAILIARNACQPEAQTNGVINNNYKLIVPQLASHYSTWNGMGWLGFGENNVIHVKTNNFRYSIKDLDAVLKKTINDGNKVLAVIATLGDPYSMTIEDICAVHKLCKKYKVWLHGDGANGGVLIFSGKYRNLIKGIELCDSVSLDPHKAMGLNYPNSIFVCKDVKKFNSVISYWNIINRKDGFDLGMITPFLNSRGFDSLKLWILLKYFGTNGVSKIIDNKIETTRKIYSEISCIKNVLFWNKPNTFSILFQVIPNYIIFSKECKDDAYVKKINEIQKEFINYLNINSKIQIHSFDLPASIFYKKTIVLGVQSTVLCIQNAHEKIPIELINEFKRHIIKFCNKN